MQYFDPGIELMKRSEMTELQLRKLRHMVTYCYENVPFYHEKLGAAGITSGEQIRSMDDIQRIPFTTKDDLRNHYPLGMLAIPYKQVKRIHASSGTTSKPTLGFYSEKDMKLWARCAARVLMLNGITKEDVFQLSVSYGLFTGAFGFHQGAELIGCTVIPASAGNTEKQLTMMRDLGVTAITATPSYSAFLAERIAQEGTLKDYRLTKLLLGAERCSANMRAAIENKLHVATADNYGLTEMFGPGVAGECLCRKGLHITEDVFYPEIINPDTGAVLGDLEQGELVFTSLEREAMPLLRYRTRDLTWLDHSPCPCGRTTVRMHAPVGRVDDMFVFKGINVFPSQIECAMAGVAGISPHYHITLTRHDCKDYARLQIELETPSSQLRPEAIRQIKDMLSANIKEVVIVRLDVDLVEPNTLERFQGKAKRVTDLRYGQEG